MANEFLARPIATRCVARAAGGAAIVIVAKTTEARRIVYARNPHRGRYTHCVPTGPVVRACEVEVAGTRAQASEAQPSITVECCLTFRTDSDWTAQVEFFITSETEWTRYGRLQAEP